ncbi:MAG: rhamnulokinase family protein [Actinomycetales bacterium]
MATPPSSPRRAYLAVDLGGASCRVVAGWFDSGGIELLEADRFANIPVERDGVLCWDGVELFQSGLRGLRTAVALCRERGLQVAGIGVDSWGVDYGLIDNHGALTAPLRHYRATTAADVARAEVRVSADEAYSRTGIEALPINTVYQLVRDADAGLLNADQTMLLTADLWTYWLSGALGAEASLASTTGLIDRQTGDWAWDLVDRYDIPASILPPVQACGTVAGVTTHAMTQQLGLDTPVPVIRTGAHDTASAFAAVDDDAGRAVTISCGTWALAGATVSEPVLTDAARQGGFTNEAGADGRTLLMRNLSGTWLLEECLRHWASSDGTAANTTDLRDDLLAQAALAHHTAARRDAPVIDPGSPVFLEPGNMPARIAAAYRAVGGQLDERDRVGLTAVVIDSLAASFAQTAEGLAGLVGQPFTSMTIIGGGARIALLQALAATRSGLRVTAGPVEATCLGNIMIQAVALGHYPTLAQARDAAGLARA